MELPSADTILDVIKKSKSLREAAETLGLSRHQIYRIVKGKNSRMDPLGVSVVREKLHVVDEHKLKKQLRDVQERLSQALEDRIETEKLLEFFEAVSDSPIQTPNWVLDPPEGKNRVGLACCALSDIHFGEVVNPAEVEYANSYDTSIATMRLHKFFSNVAKVYNEYLSGVDFQGLVMFWLGDFISGDIHEELRETNETSTIHTVLELSGILVAGVKLLADSIGNVHIKCVVGNHGRNSKKPRSKKRVINNFDWLVYHLVKREFADDPRVSFEISESADLRVRIYNTTFVATHGDQFRGGSGISGALAPLLLGDHRKRKRAQSLKAPYDCMVMGHFHQYISGMSGIMVNGSIVGYNEYAYDFNLNFEPPQQSFWVVDPEHGVTFKAPIFVQDKSEGWYQ